MRSAILALTALLLFAAPAGVHAANLSASPSNLSTVFGSAQPGDTISLASGDYGTFTGGAKAGMVTLQPAAGAAASMVATFNGASNITLAGLTMKGLDIGGKSHDLRVLNSAFTGQADLDMTGNANANILIDGNTFDGISVCADCAEGRLEVRQYPLGTQPVGVTISHNHFGGAGQSDGVQDGAYGVVIDGNTFDGIVQATGYTRHIDSIQLYGQSHTTIINNYMRNFTTAIMAPDGGDHEIIDNNVIIAPSAGSSAVQFGHQNGTTFIHNTVKNTDVHAWVGSGDATPNRSMILRDNVMVAAGFVASGCVSCTLSYNLFSKGPAGTNALTATPVFSGGSNPTTYAGWALAKSSPGKGNASDGTDRGINVGASIPGTPTVPGGGGASAPAGASPATAATSPVLTSVNLPASAGSAFAVRWSMKPRKPHAGAKVVLTAPKTKAGGRKCVWTVARGVTRRGCQIAVRFAKAGRKHIAVRISDRSGSVVRGSRDVTIEPRAKAAKKTKK